MTHRRAFTFTEFLVALAILAAVAAMVSPAVVRARSNSDRITCAANLHRLASALTAYANAHRDHLPVGHVAGQQQLSYLYRDTAGQTYWPGLLSAAHLLPPVEAIACPAETNAAFNPDTADNPWHRTAGQNTRLTFALRPGANWPSGAGFPSRIPTRTDLPDNALAADPISDGRRVRERHRDGANVAYSDGRVEFVPLAAFNAPLSRISDGFSSLNNPHQAAVWSALDRH